MLNGKFLVPVLLCAEIAIFGDGLDRVLSEAKKGLSKFLMFL